MPQTAALLANATLHTDKYYGSDVKVAYRLTRALLQHESNQQGFNLTATQDVHFTEVTTLERRLGGRRCVGGRETIGQLEEEA